MILLNILRGSIRGSIGEGGGSLGEVSNNLKVTSPWLKSSIIQEKELPGGRWNLGEALFARLICGRRVFGSSAVRKKSILCSLFSKQACRSLSLAVAGFWGVWLLSLPTARLAIRPKTNPKTERNEGMMPSILLSLYRKLLILFNKYAYLESADRGASTHPWQKTRGGGVLPGGRDASIQEQYRKPVLFLGFSSGDGVDAVGNSGRLCWPFLAVFGGAGVAWNGI